MICLTAAMLVTFAGCSQMSGRASNTPPVVGTTHDWATWLEDAAKASPAAPVEARIVFRCGILAGEITEHMPVSVKSSAILIAVTFLVRPGYSIGWPVVPHKSLSEGSAIGEVIREYGATYELTTADTGQAKLLAVRSMKAGDSAIVAIDISAPPAELIAWSQSQSGILLVIPRLDQRPIPNIEACK